MRGHAFFVTAMGQEDAGKGKGEMVALDASEGPATARDTVIHGVSSTPHAYRSAKCWGYRS